MIETNMQPEIKLVVSDPKAADFHRELEQGSKRVSSCRLYRLDGVRKVDFAEWIEADDDGAAIAVAKERFTDRRCEIWFGPGLVARLGRGDRGG